MIVYMGIILCVRPYVRKGDDRLHLLALCEIFLVMLSGMMFERVIETDEATDLALSIFLICGFSLFIVVFAVQSANAVQKLLSMRREKRRREKMSKDQKSFDKKFQNDLGMMKLAQQEADRDHFASGNDLESKMNSRMFGSESMGSILGHSKREGSLLHQSASRDNVSPIQFASPATLPRDAISADDNDGLSGTHSM